MSAVSELPEGHMAGASEQPLISIRGLAIGFPARDGTALAVHDVSFEAFAGQTLGIVGESGCGKSLSLRAPLGLVPAPGNVVRGEITWRNGIDLLSLDSTHMRAIRGREISMIFQDPLESLNPVFSIGSQLTEVLRTQAGLSRTAARARAIELLDRVGIPSAAARMRDFPHQLSGGMRQRVMIAIAIACEPQLLLADEPTTALDVTIQDQILTLLADLQRESGLSIMLVSHDLGVVAQLADRVAVMYAGHVMETGPVDRVLSAPRHPYTAALIASSPEPAGGPAGSRLQTIPGAPPSINDRLAGCPFAPRCRFATDQCRAVDMRLDNPGGHASACPVVDVTAKAAHRHGH
ncbi:MAG: peptide/nickel transport system ATP-binding protein [Solirubrobacteraceae bacterium]